VESNIGRDQRVMWAFGLAAGVVAIGAFAPLVFSAGGQDRIEGVIIPFGIAAVALAVNAFMFHQGRALAVTLYFIAGLAIVYGILAMLAVPLRLAVVGTCPAATTHCPLGFEQPMTTGENSGLGTATFCGILAIFIAFYGLMLLYRRRRVLTPRESTAWPAEAPVQATAAISTPPPAPAEMPAPAPTSKPAAADPDDAPKELPAPEEPKELPPAST
jgi:hypothetical protein